MFRLLNNRLDPAQPPSYDPPVLRMTVRYIEHIPSFRSKGPDTYDAYRNRYAGNRDFHQPAQQHPGWIRSCPRSS